MGKIWNIIYSSCSERASSIRSLFYGKYGQLQKSLNGKNEKTIRMDDSKIWNEYLALGMHD